jgi:phenylalanyl-tRNA synthetase alpha chain
MHLPERQVAVLEAASTEKRSIDALATELDMPPEAVAGAAFALEEAGLLTVTERTETTWTITPEGVEYARTERDGSDADTEGGLPENRLYAAVRSLDLDDGVPMGEAIGAATLEGPQVDVALANYGRKGFGTVADGTITADPDADPGGHPEQETLDALASGNGGEGSDGNDAPTAVLERLAERTLVEREERTVREVALTDAGSDALAEGVAVESGLGQITPDLLASGEWRDTDFTDYDVAADAEEPPAGKTHILRQTAERVTDVLVGMGFQEMDGPHVDAQFWINDCLFMPQDHPARTHWDQFALAEPAEIGDLPAELVDRVESAHRDGVGEDGEGYHSPWEASVARQLDLRGHTTSLSMRYLSGQEVGELEPPERYFSVEKVYRNDTLDPTHLLEFFQIEGWVMAEDLSVRDLMGTFTAFYEQFGITDLEFKPHYNPYTEPSFELFGRHPDTGELIEIGNSGMFREEVLEPLGVECDVMAWGLALERLLMLMYGFEDIRDVHGTLCDLELLRETEVVY